MRRLRVVCLAALGICAHVFLRPVDQRRVSQRSRRVARGAEGEGDWREFRARLVQQELSREAEVDAISLKKAEQWAYESPIIEQGSILLSAPSDHFCMNQQYFHKNVIFLVRHSDEFTMGVILNRPTALSTNDIESEAALGFSQEMDDWNVWCGGDCQGINDRGSRVPLEYSVLHGMEQLAESSQTITQGVYAIELDKAKELVAAGEVDKDDFLLLVGYCGWHSGQLQGELDRGDTWTMASVDPRSLLGQLRDEQAALRKRLSAAEHGDVFTSNDVGDGLDMWERLYRALGPKYEQRLTDFEATGENEHADEMLRTWINRCLIPQQYNVEKEVPEGEESSLIPNGAVLRGSARHWLLGKPTEAKIFHPQDFLPAQYFHKAVVLVIKNELSGVLLALLNGPVVHTKSQITWGGPQGAGVTYEVQDEENNLKGFFQGFTVLHGMGTLERLVELGALELTEASLQELLSVEPEERWRAAGGHLRTLRETELAQLGDKQRRKWFKRFLDLDL
ncbi:unnamed protein product [Effrenium voratum]|nr:unnamed protein product [Effrenium voratum]|mmetsp:Transcript_15464/g.36561  ORF Transcript_15464/g.36561 Transcript_15464/m.36561 type:complete len:508 (+) Transcript_15464:34-1557(+)